jgi:hypothetical protein
MREQRSYLLVPRIPWRPWEGDGVAHIGEPGDVGEGAPGESRGEAEAGVRDRAVAAQVAVPGVLLSIDAAFRPCCGPMLRAAPRAGCRR